MPGMISPDVLAVLRGSALPQILVYVVIYGPVPLLRDGKRLKKREINALAPLSLAQTHAA